VKAWGADNAKLQHLFFLYPRYSDSAHRDDHKYHLFYSIINPFRWEKPATLNESERGEKSLTFSKIYTVFLNVFLSLCKFCCQILRRNWTWMSQIENPSSFLPESHRSRSFAKRIVLKRGTKYASIFFWNFLSLWGEMINIKN